MLTLAQFQKQLKAGTLAGAREIRLSCALTEFPAELFEFVDTLEILDIGGNQLRKLPDSLSRFRKLRVLFASGNPMTEFPSMLNKMPSLEMIGFKACQIRHVPENSLPPHLRWLILKGYVVNTHVAIFVSHCLSWINSIFMAFMRCKKNVAWDSEARLKSLG